MADEDKDADETTETEETTETPTEEAAEPQEEKKKKIKKVVRRRKTKKERENPLTMAVRLAVESGKVDFGGKAGISSALDSAKLFVIANNAPEDIKGEDRSAPEDINIPIILFEGSSMELGAVCGKPFPVSVLSVFEQGSSNILELAKKK